MKEKIAILSTCDTKGYETSYLRDQIIKFGGDPLVIDVGTKSEPIGIEPDITHHQLAAYIGLTVEDIQNSGSRGEAIEKMSSALRACMHDLQNQGALCGVVCIAGSGGSVLVTEVMQDLPYGLPKLLTSPITSGTRQFGPFVGTSDMTIMHSVVDILGINHMSRKVFANTAGAIVGMSKAYLAEAAMDYSDEKLIGITMYGQTTPGVMHAKDLLEKNGYRCLVFHGNGVGGPSMERLIKDEIFVGILDYNLSEMVGNYISGFTKCTTERLSVAGNYGLPQVIVPGSLDFINLYPPEAFLPEYKDRVIYNHNKAFPLARTSKEENIILAKEIAKKLNGSKGAVRVLLPLKGFSSVNYEGGPFWNKDVDDAFRNTLREHLDKKIPVADIDANINDKECGEAAANALMELIEAG